MLIRGDARHLPLADGSVQCVVTSPPYFGLRKYTDLRSIGLEASPGLYVAELVACFHEVWRVLRDDGTLWLVIADSYANDGKWGGETGGKQAYLPEADRQRNGREKRLTHLPAKSLIGIPWRVAFAFQADGWILRSDIIWAKGISFCDTYSGSVMPESVKDRPMQSHEHLFLLAKNEYYFYDHLAVRERGIWPAGTRAAKGSGMREGNRRGTTTPRKQDHLGRTHQYPGAGGYRTYDGFRNLRSVWAIPTQPSTDEHYAAFPEALVMPCVLAGSRPGDVVLDPFVGSGTTVAVAERLGRRGVGVDLSYQDLATERTAQRGLRLVMDDEERGVGDGVSTRSDDR